LNNEVSVAVSDDSTNLGWFTKLAVFSYDWSLLRFLPGFKNVSVGFKKGYFVAATAAAVINAFNQQFLLALYRNSYEADLRMKDAYIDLLRNVPDYSSLK
jgi:hypothetical protein